MDGVQDTSKLIKNKKATVNSKNTVDKCFRYAVNAVLNYEIIKKNPQGTLKIKPFID